MYEYAFSDFERRYPATVAKIEKILSQDINYIRARLNDGAVVEYDVDECTLRRLPKDPNNLTEKEYRNELKYRLRKILYCKSISQKELAESSGIPQSTISKYINGETTPSSYAMDKIAKALDCSVDEFRYLKNIRWD